MPSTTRVALIAASLVLSAACEGPASRPLELKEGCNPLLAGADCTLPYPSDFFRVPDEGMPSGFRIALEGEGRVYTEEGYTATPMDWRAVDGYSKVPSVTFVLGAPAAREGLVGIFDDDRASTLPSHATTLLDADTGEAIPHFVDFDGRTADPNRQAIVLRASVPLEWERRYVVAIHGIKGPDGAVIAAPEGFRRLRDGDAHPEGPLAALAARYDDDVFAPIAAFGIARGDLQLAWDFTTGTEAFAVSDMVRVRELVLEALEASPPVLEEVTVQEHTDDPYVWRSVYGRITGPNVMAAPGPGADLSRDAEGRVALNGTTTFEFTAKIPRSVRDGFAPGRAVAYGHGFFGSQGEVDGTATERVADATGAVLFAIDWWGMSVSDVSFVLGALGAEERTSKVPVFMDRVHQSMANWLTLSAAIRGALKEEEVFHRPQSGAGVASSADDETVTNAGDLVYDATRLGYVGISQGHILGTAMVALNPWVDRSVLQVGGASFAHMMTRAKPFLGFLTVMDLSIPDPLDQMKVRAIWQRYFDRIDPATYAPFILSEELPFGPENNLEERQVLMQVGMADTQVPNFTSFLHARGVGLPLLAPTPLEPNGLSTVLEGESSSALTIFDFGSDHSWADVATPPDFKAPAHGGIRSSEEGLAQMRAFLNHGVIIHPCDGPCRINAN